MPELPEAETIGRVLKRALVGRKITEVHVFSPAMREPLTPLLDAELPGRRFVDVRRRARYVIAELDDGRALLMHFGMSGVVRVEPADVPKRKHEPGARSGSSAPADSACANSAACRSRAVARRSLTASAWNRSPTDSAGNIFSVSRAAGMAR